MLSRTLGKQLRAVVPDVNARAFSASGVRPAFGFKGSQTGSSRRNDDDSEGGGFKSYGSRPKPTWQKDGGDRRGGSGGFQRRDSGDSWGQQRASRDTDGGDSGYQRPRRDMDGGGGYQRGRRDMDGGDGGYQRPRRDMDGGSGGYQRPRRDFDGGAGGYQRGRRDAGGFDGQRGGDRTYGERPPREIKPSVHPDHTILVLRNLPYELTGDDLIHWFKSLATPTGVRMALAQGSAFIEFESHQDAQTVLEAQPYNIAGRNVFSGWSTHKTLDPPQALLFISDLPKTIDAKTVQNVLAEHAPVQEIVLRPTSDGEHVFAYAAFKTPEEMQLVLEQREAISFDGQRARIVPMAGNETGVSVLVSSGYSEPSNKLFIGNLDYNMDEPELQQALERVAPVTSVKLLYRKGGDPSGFAFVEMASVDDAFKVFEAHGTTPFKSNERDLSIRWSQPTREQPSKPTENMPSAKLYIGNMPYTVTDADLQRLIAPHGEPQTISMPMEGAGYAFVQFATVEEAQAALESMEKAAVEVEGRPFKVRYAQNGGERSSRSGGGDRSSSSFSGRSSRGGGSFGSRPRRQTSYEGEW